MSPKKQDANTAQAMRNTTTQKDVQKRYQQDFSRYKKQTERVSQTVDRTDSPKAA